MNMKKFITFLLFLSPIFAQVQYAPNQFSELKGILDSNGNSHLLFRIYSDFYEGSPTYYYITNNIYDYNLETFEERLFLKDSNWCNISGGGGEIIFDYDVWNKDLTKYIYCGILRECWNLPNSYISRYNSNYVYLNSNNYIQNISISRQNENLIYAGAPILKSNDGGYNWSIFSDTLSFLALSPFNDQSFFATGTWIDLKGYPLYKTINGGDTYYVVDTTENPIDLLFDVDGQHVYNGSYLYPFLSVSSNQGEPGSWYKIFTPQNFNAFCALDESQSGAIYLADGKKIFHSTDYGNNFLFFRELDKNIIGIYKKPNSNRLYAATKYNIYEITENSISIIRSISLPQETFSYYPLQIGNCWVYNYEFQGTNGERSFDFFVKRIYDEIMMPNGKKYYKIEEKYLNQGVNNFIYERLDSSTGKIYRYSQDCPSSEFLIDDLLLEEVGDSSRASRFNNCSDSSSTFLTSVTSYNKWGLTGFERKYNHSTMITTDYSLATNIGLNQYTISDVNGTKTYKLKGMIDDGTIYGDTLTSFGWHRLNISTNNNLTSVSFIDSQNGWICGGDGLVLHTTDGGNVWLENLVPTPNNLTAIKFLSDTNGWVVGQNVLLKTTDNGSNWELKTPSYTFWPASICLLNSDSIWMTGLEVYGNDFWSVAIKTNDGGSSFIKTDLDIHDALGGFFIDYDIGYIVGGNFYDAKIIKTTNSGVSWASNTFSNYGNFKTIFFLDRQMGWIVGNNGKILKTTNGGIDWMDQISPSNLNLTSVHFLDSANGWISGQSGLILNTTDGGTNWSIQATPTSNNLNCIHFINLNNGWSVGTDGTILHTTNGGISFIETKFSPVQLENFVLQQNFPNPFNPTTKISWQSPVSSWQTLKVYDVLGKEVTTLVNEERPAGNHEVEFDASHLSSGVYFYILKVGDFIQSKKMILLK